MGGKRAEWKNCGGIEEPVEKKNVNIQPLHIHFLVDKETVDKLTHSIVYLIVFW